MPHAVLTSRAVLAVCGEDRVAFLQGLISNDVRRLDAGRALYAALLTPQGKFLHDFFLYPGPNEILIDINAPELANFTQRLMMYKLRSRVSFEPRPEIKIAACWDETPEMRDGVYADPRLPALGYRMLASAHWPPGPAGDYGRMRLMLGVPEGGRDMIPEKSFLLEWGIDQLHGVDYQKGCYVGQEVTARTHYRGHVKKAPYIVRTDGPALPASSTIIYCGEAEAGELRSSNGNLGLALLRMEVVEQSLASGMPLRAADVVVSAAQPSWFSPPKQ